MYRIYTDSAADYLYRIYTDSAADLPHEMFSEHDIRVVPMTYEIGGSVVLFYTDSEDRDQLCAEVLRAGQQGVHVRTSQIPPLAYEEIWREELEAGWDVLYVSISSAMSGNFANATVTARELMEEFPERTIEVVDSLSATAGEGLLTLSAAEKRKEGLSITENAAWLRENVRHVFNHFVAGDTGHLPDGGRFPRVLAVGNGPDIKHLFSVGDDGKIHFRTRARGIKQARKRLLEEYMANREVPGVTDIVLITHSADPEGGESLRSMVAEAVGQETKVRTVCLSPIVAIHTGFKHFAICGWGKKR